MKKKRPARRGKREIQQRRQELRPYLDSLPWDSWKIQYITRKNTDGTWYYRSLRHFAIQMVVTKQVGNGAVKVTPDQFTGIVEYKCGPFEVLSSDAYRQTAPYHSDWNEARVGYRWGVENTKAATDLAKVDRQVYLMEQLNFPISRYKTLVTQALRMMVTIEGYYQGQFILEDTFYDSSVAPRAYRGKSTKEIKKAERLQAEYDLIQAKMRAQDDRFTRYCTMMDRAHKMFEAACEGIRKTLQVGMPKIELRQSFGAPAQPSERGNNMERIAAAFLQNAEETASNFEFDRPRFVTVDAHPVDEPVPEREEVASPTS